MTNEIHRHYSAFGGQIKEFFELKPGQLFLDLTLGDGGHTEEVLKAGCKVVSFDIDPEAIQRAIKFVSGFTPIVITDIDHLQPIEPDFKWIIVNANFDNVLQICQKLNLSNFAGILIDLGPSQFQVLSPGRGFSFSIDEPLDMRLDKNLGVTAKDLVNALNEGELRDLLQFSDEPFARQIARAIVKARQLSPIVTTKQLADLVSQVKHQPLGRIHPATQVFMALRMVVNLEREVIKTVMPQLPQLLSTNGILGVISFHSTEDRLVKEYLQEAEENGTLVAINKKPLEPNAKELLVSQRTRSAKFRLARKIN